MIKIWATKIPYCLTVKIIHKIQNFLTDHSLENFFFFFRSNLPSILEKKINTVAEQLNELSGFSNDYSGLSNEVSGFSNEFSGFQDDFSGFWRLLEGAEVLEGLNEHVGLDWLCYVTRGDTIEYDLDPGFLRYNI